MVELVIVMTLMVIAVGIAAPSLKSFLKGRDLEDEARRFLSLTRYGLSRAEAEGLPVDLWVNVKQGRYGLAASSGYTESRTNNVFFYLSNESDVRKQDIQIRVLAAPNMLTSQSNFWTPSAMRGGIMPVIRLQPDGFISETSPRAVIFQQGTDPEIWIVENTNHLRYDIDFNHAKTTRY
jgi:Tfp pilus assembly protein FimT